MADFEKSVGRPTKTHAAQAIAAGTTNAKTISFLHKPPKAVTVYWSITGAGAPEVKLFAVHGGAEHQIGATSTAANGKISLPAGEVVGLLKVQIRETLGVSPITATAEVVSSN